MKDDKSKLDPYKLFKAIGEIIAEREGIKVVLVSVTEKKDSNAKST